MGLGGTDVEARLTGDAASRAWARPVSRPRYFAAGAAGSALHSSQPRTNTLTFG
jgi:hypothetical protein